MHGGSGAIVTAKLFPWRATHTQLNGAYHQCSFNTHREETPPTDTHRHTQTHTHSFIEGLPLTGPPLPQHPCSSRGSRALPWSHTPARGPPAHFHTSCPRSSSYTGPCLAADVRPSLTLRLKNTKNTCSKHHDIDGSTCRSPVSLSPPPLLVLAVCPCTILRCGGARPPTATNEDVTVTSIA